MEGKKTVFKMEMQEDGFPSFSCERLLRASYFVSAQGGVVPVAKQSNKGKSPLRFTPPAGKSALIHLYFAWEGPWTRNWIPSPLFAESEMLCGVPGTFASVPNSEKSLLRSEKSLASASYEVFPTFGFHGDLSFVLHISSQNPSKSPRYPQYCLKYMLSP